MRAGPRRVAPEAIALGREALFEQPPTPEDAPGQRRVVTAYQDLKNLASEYGVQQPPPLPIAQSAYDNRLFLLATAAYADAFANGESSTEDRSVVRADYRLTTTSAKSGRVGRILRSARMDGQPGHRLPHQRATPTRQPRGMHELQLLVGAAHQVAIARSRPTDQRGRGRTLMEERWLIAVITLVLFMAVGCSTPPGQPAAVEQRPPEEAGTSVATAAPVVTAATVVAPRLAITPQPAAQSGQVQVAGDGFAGGSRCHRGWPDRRPHIGPGDAWDCDARPTAHSKRTR